MLPNVNSNAASQPADRRRPRAEAIAVIQRRPTRSAAAGHHAAIFSSGAAPIALQSQATPAKKLGHAW